MKKRFLSLFLALALCMGLCAVPALAADQKLHFGLIDSGDYSNISLVETDGSGDEDGPYSISGTDLRQTGTVVYPEYGESGYRFTVPVYTASAPVTVTVEYGEERGVPMGGAQVGWAQVDLVSYDATNKTYDVLKEHILFFDGYFSFKNQFGKVEDISIKEYCTNDDIWDRMEESYGICRGATATLSVPGTYRIEADYRGLEGSYEVFVTITDGASDTPTPSASSFTDVSPTAYYADAVKWAVEKNITNGTSTTTFSPEKACTNAEILTFLWRAAGEPGISSEIVVYFDLAPNQWYTVAILWATEKGIISRDFQLDAPCTRSSAVKYIWQAKGSPDPAAPSAFTDVPAGADYSPAVAWAIEAGVTKGTGGGKFSPADTCTRGQIVTFLHRAMGQ